MNKKLILIGILVIFIVAGVAAYFFYFQPRFMANKNKEKIEISNNIYESYKEGDLDTSIELSKQLLEKDPNNIDYQIKLADSYVNKGSIDHEESKYAPMAIEIIKSVLERDPNNSEAYMVLGYAYETLQKFDEALKNYDKTIQLNGSNAFAYNARGHAYDLIGNFDKAESDYSKAYELNPNEPSIWMNMARINLLKGDIEKSKEFALKVVESTTTDYIKSTAYSTLSQVYVYEENIEKALEASTKAIEFLPKFIFGYMSRANIVINKYYNDSTKIITEDEIKTVKSDLDTAISLNLNSSFSFYYYARLFELTKEYDRAIEYYNKAISVIENDLAIPLEVRPYAIVSFEEAIKNVNNLKK